MERKYVSIIPRGVATASMKLLMYCPSQVSSSTQSFAIRYISVSAQPCLLLHIVTVELISYHEMDWRRSPIDALKQRSTHTIRVLSCARCRSGYYKYRVHDVAQKANTVTIDLRLHPIEWFHHDRESRTLDAGEWRSCGCSGGSGSVCFDLLVITGLITCSFIDVWDRDYDLGQMFRRLELVSIANCTVILTKNNKSLVGMMF